MPLSRLSMLCRPVSDILCLICQVYLEIFLQISHWFLLAVLPEQLETHGPSHTHPHKYYHPNFPPSDFQLVQIFDFQNILKKTVDLLPRKILCDTICLYFALWLITLVLNFSCFYLVWTGYGWIRRDEGNLFIMLKLGLEQVQGLRRRLFVKFCKKTQSWRTLIEGGVKF